MEPQHAVPKQFQKPSDDPIISEKKIWEKISSKQTAVLNALTSKRALSNYRLSKKMPSAATRLVVILFCTLWLSPAGSPVAFSVVSTKSAYSNLCRVQSFFFLLHSNHSMNVFSVLG